MKIGVLTVPFNNNYGGTLQAFALVTYLRSLGHEVIFIDLKHKNKTINLLKSFIKILFNRLTAKKYSKTINPVVNSRLKNIIKSEYFNSFIDKNISPKISPIYSSLELSILSAEMGFDCFIVGSDQVWRPKYMNSLIETSFLDFGKFQSIKRISYAASFGTDVWEYSPRLTKKCSKLLKLFDKISVREDAGVKVCKEHFQVEASLVLDPTFLLEKHNYDDLCSDEFNLVPNDNIFCYLLDNNNEKQRLISTIKNILNLPSNEILSKIPKIELWLANISKSKFVITDSFHGMVFSIIYNKNFVVIGNKERGLNRFSSLLKLLKLENRLIFDISDITSDLISNSINYYEVNNLLDQYINSSRKFLQEI